MGDISSNAPLQRLLKENPERGKQVPLLILKEGELTML